MEAHAKANEQCHFQAIRMRQRHRWRPAPAAAGKDSRTMLTADEFAALPSLRHGFFTRLGGVSDGRYDSMNCGLGSGDAPDRVAENRARAMARLGLPGDALVTARQVHSARAVVVDAPWTAADRPELDGLATRTPGLALGILTADCAPVLFADAEAGVVGAAHAGWRGAKDGILEATIAAMETLGARREAITAAIGPCIRQGSYEVTDEFRDALLAGRPSDGGFFVGGVRPGRWQFDLPGYVAGRLAAAGIATLSVLPHDPCADAGRFFSYRRVTLDGGGDYGRQLSTIALVP
jgi:polyphenol oxidase